MSGSFPCAFKAQKWQSEWGRYNVFYSHERLSIDLTDHEFTDGGLLANFPIKYLDNASMNKKYFSHTPQPGSTIILGFGLDQITNYNPSMK